MGGKARPTTITLTRAQLAEIRKKCAAIVPRTQYVEVGWRSRKGTGKRCSVDHNAITGGEETANSLEWCDLTSDLENTDRLHKLVGKPIRAVGGRVVLDLYVYCQIGPDWEDGELWGNLDAEIRQDGSVHVYDPHPTRSFGSSFEALK